MMIVSVRAAAVLASNASLGLHGLEIFSTATNPQSMHPCTALVGLLIGLAFSNVGGIIEEKLLHGASSSQVVDGFLISDAMMWL
jgi:hypothetical protein